GRLRASSARPRRRAAAMSPRRGLARRVASPSRARRALPLSLRARSCASSSRKSDDLRSGSRIAKTVNAGPCRRTRGILSGLVGDEIVEVGVGEHAARALRAVTDDDVAERAGGDVAGERLDRAAELARGLGGRARPSGLDWRGLRSLHLAGAPGSGIACRPSTIAMMLSHWAREKVRRGARISAMHLVSQNSPAAVSSQFD